MKYSKYGKKKGFFAGKGFYIVLAACIAAVGVAAWSAMDAISSVEDKTSSSWYTPSRRPIVSDADDVNQTVSDVQKPQSSTPESSEPAPSSQAQAPSSQPQTAEQYFTVPVKGNIGKTFSSTNLQYSKTYGDMRLHMGVDILAEKGVDVVAASSGRVQSVVQDGLWGKMVVIDHGMGIICYYCGLENTTVSEGEQVKSGTKLGVVGTVPSECDDASHIHIAITRDGKYISPLELMSGQ